MKRNSMKDCLRFIMAMAVGCLGATAVDAQQDPHIGYVFPAGGRIGTTVEVTVGGQFLTGTTDVHVSGQALTATILDHHRPISQGEANQLRNKIDEAQQKLEAQGKEKVNIQRKTGAYAELLEILKDMGVTEEDFELLEEYQQRTNDPKRQLNPQIEETVKLRLELDPNAQPGHCEIRLQTPSGVSNPILFCLSEYPEHRESEPNDRQVNETIEGPLPVVLNGQIMPGDVDRFRFVAEKGDRLVIAASARELIPYLADAVPGWFQAVIVLYDANGREVGYMDDFQFHPDPVMYVRIPADGQYELEIRDSIYRGREDFVYRITVGEYPFVTSVFPLGVQQGTTAEIALEGWNLPVDTISFDATNKLPGKHPISVRARKLNSNQVPVLVDTMPEILEQEPNNRREEAQLLNPPQIVNGRMDAPGDWDVFRFEGHGGGQVMLEVLARRINSPMDSLVKVTDASGKQLAVNDDFVDRGAGLVTHHADSQLRFLMPEDGSYFIHLGDTQKKGGSAFAYRLRVSAQLPDFDLRVVPSSINARPGATVPITVHALRHDGFDQDISVRLKNAPDGFELTGDWIPAEEVKVEMALKVPAEARDQPYRIELEGEAEIKGELLVRRAVPAEDMMQAFLWRHLVPTEDLMVYVSAKARPSSAVAAQPARKVDPENLLQIPLGGMVRHQVAIPDRSDLKNVGVELSDPPPGIAIVRVIRGPGGLVMLLTADAEMIKAGMQGELVLSVFEEKTIPGRNGRPGTKRRVPVENFPAIPFEVVQRKRG